METENDLNRKVLRNLSILDGSEEGAAHGREVGGKGVQFVFHFLTRLIDEMSNRRR